ncbi:hypothetical protein A2223_00520 [Candidatus Falkowbacteria bacterium RIFOXYA2_FULL_35_8]|nr:MAG: hypothetical protein A2223_00520 [Candidatus Falkowbacteria bacterium RIFOXYA2_FULL_35_8]
MPHHHEYRWHLFQDFRNIKLSGPLTALFSCQLIQQVANGLIGLFIPVFLYQKLGFSLIAVSLYCLASYTSWFLLVPVGAKWMSKIGIKKSLIISVVFSAFYFLSLQFFDLTDNRWWLLSSIFFVDLTRMFFWVQYHTDFAKFSNKSVRGRQISLFSSVASLVAVLIPFISGLMLENYGFGILFISALIIYLASALPLFMIPEVKEEYSFGYLESFKQLFSAKNKRMLWSYSADGAQGFIGMVLWPLFIWLVLDENYAAVGLVSSIIILVSIIVRLIVGEYSDKLSKKKILKLGTALYAIGWIFKIFVFTGFQIFIASTYHNFAEIVMRTPYDALMYDKAADSGKMVDEYNTMREIALNFGRILIILLIIAGFYFTGDLTLSFILAAVTSLLINLI